MRAGHALYFDRVVPLLGALLSDRAAYAYLPRSVAYLPSEAELLGLLGRAGFRACRGARLFGAVQLITAVRVRSLRWTPRGVGERARLQPSDGARDEALA